jgi:NADH:ubiquinone oxidoreductase subunit F (NADH-binding)/Pyruvate/2-oxoacid:ferredoxin oxidoreductase delta subunit
VSFDVISPSCGSTLFTQEDRAFPAIREALALGREATLARLASMQPGGEGQMIATSMQLCWNADSNKKVVVARVLDTVPGAVIQSTLLARAPLAILEGLWISAFVVGASKAVVALEAPSDELSRGITELGRLGLLAFDVDGTVVELAIEVVTVQRCFMAGEDTSLVQLLEGRPALASQTKVELRGYGDNPTFVQSAETMVNLAHGVLGPGKPPTTLFQVLGAVKREALVEVSAGTSLRSVVFDLCGGMKGAKGFKFALVGGPTGGFIPADGLDQLLDPTSLASAGIVLGSSTIVVGDEGDCTVDMALRCLSFSAAENCGICVICREGTYQLKELLADATSGKTRPDDEAIIQELSTGLREASLCAIGRQAPSPLLTGLRHFGEEFEAHLKRKRCPALVCKQYVTFHILGETCTGCGKCLAICPEEAIEGEEDYIHVIDAGACTKCGLCYEVCPPEAAAVVKAGAIKPRTPKEPIPVGTWKKR